MGRPLVKKSPSLAGYVFGAVFCAAILVGCLGLFNWSGENPNADARYTPLPSVAPPKPTVPRSIVTPPALSPTPAISIPPIAAHYLINENIQDTPGKAQVTRNYRLTAPTSIEGVDALLRAGLRDARASRAFKHRVTANMVDVHVLTEKDQRVGSLLWSEGNEPEVTVIESVVASMNTPDVSRFGKNEPERMKIWTAAAGARYRSEDEADAMFLGKGLGKEGLQKASAEEKRRRTIYEAEVMEQHNLTREQFDAIIVEAIQKQWPMPKRPPR